METKIINTTAPNAEVKAPATATTPATIAATTTAPVNTTATTPPVPATVPVSTTTAPSNMPPAIGTATATPATDSTAATMLKGYLSGGYFQGEGKCRYPDPDLVGQAEAIAKELSASNTPPAALNRMVRTLKTAARLPYPAKQGALKKLTPQVLDLENKKKAPPLLREVVERNQAAVKNEADYAACLDHFKDIGIYLTAAQS